MNHHPSKDNPDSYLWITANYNNKKLTYSRVCDILKATARRARVKKAVNPHNFRHSRATHLAKHLTEAQMKEHFGWVQSSDMAATYIHMSSRDVDPALFKLYGIKDDPENQKEDTALNPKQCNRCDFENPATNIYCSRCGLALDEKVQLDILKNDLERKKGDSVMDHFLKDPNFKEMLLKKTAELMAEKSSMAS